MPCSVLIKIMKTKEKEKNLESRYRERTHYLWENINSNHSGFLTDTMAARKKCLNTSRAE